MSRNPRTIFEVPYITSPSYGPPSQQLVNPLMEIWITADPIEINTNAYGNMTHFPVAVRNPSLDTVFDCRRLGNDGLAVGIPVIDVTVSGTWLNVNIVALPIELTATILGTCIPGILLSNAALIELTVTIGDSDTITLGDKRNWVEWSNIGSLDFTVWKDNIAGERPIDWKGWVYAIKKLGNKVIVYGEGGVSMLAPSGNTYGLLSVHGIGLKGRQAVAGNSKVQFFVDNSGKLYSVGETVMKASLFEASIYPEKLDYSEYLSSMGDLVLSWDELNNILYICDGTSGYVYSVADKSLGKGPTNVTGIGIRGTSSYVVSPALITTPVFEIWTDTYDMGTRNRKKITSVDFGLDVDQALSASIKYRLNKNAVFSQSEWYTVDSKGMAFIGAYGLEFQFGVKATTWEQFKIDYINVNGVIYDS